MTGPQECVKDTKYTQANSYHLRIRLEWYILSGFTAERSMPVPYIFVDEDLKFPYKFGRKVLTNGTIHGKLASVSDD